MVKNLILGVTGPIAAGKSLAIDLIKQHVKDRIPVHHLDGDTITHGLLDRNRGLHRLILEAFGRSVFRSPNRIDRRTLGNIVFQDKEKMEQLNRIIRPKILRCVRQELSRLKKTPSPGLVIIDGALLIEMELDKLCDVVVEITADRTIRRQRLMERNGLSIQQAEDRINSQSVTPIGEPEKLITILNQASPQILRHTITRKLRPVLASYFPGSGLDTE
ncbi:MAG: dephospho-CoA kinase [Candidatus Delongbacteria bacterium]|nr:dephospho-CoA kinase [Candidatus Delongbacteria bacterium]